jgi:hypothetical protein
MSTWAFRTLIVTAADAPLARDIAVTLSPEGGKNMWLAAYSADGSEPATHYVSTGAISPEFAALMPDQTWEQDENGNWTMTDSVPGDAAMLHGLCVAAGMTVTLQDIDAVFTASDVTEQEPGVALTRLGLQAVQTELG